MNVGLRLKFGQVEDRVALDAHVSRFGLDQERLRAEARAIEALPHLRLTTLHCMVGAAQTIPVDRFVASLRLAGRIFAQLRLEHPSLHELNIGGGVPPLGEAYNHRALLTGLMQALAEEAAEAGAPAPDLTFEFGSLVAAEAGFHVFRVMQRKANHHAGTDSEPAMPWAILDGGLMAAIPDMLLIDKPFRFLSIWGANAPAIQARLGDLSCDSDGRYPPESFGERASVWLPEMEGPSWLLIQGVGAYQEILSGVRGAHHCGLLEAIELVLERHADGQIRGRIMPRQTPTEAAAVLGYTDEAAAALKRTLPPSSSDR